MHAEIAKLDFNLQVKCLKFCNALVLGSLLPRWMTAVLLPLLSDLGPQTFAKRHRSCANVNRTSNFHHWSSEPVGFIHETKNCRAKKKKKIQARWLVRHWPRDCREFPSRTAHTSEAASVVDRTGKQRDPSISGVPLRRPFTLQAHRKLDRSWALLRKWNEMERDGLEWDGMEWNGIKDSAYMHIHDRMHSG